MITHPVIAQDEVVVLSHEDVLRLNVSVADVATVKRVDCSRQLVKQFHDVLALIMFVKVLEVALPETVIEVALRAELCDRHLVLFAIDVDDASDQKKVPSLMER